MNLKQIETFRAIMVTGSISAAAKLLFVSQPAVSRLLSHTELRLGYPLFERIKGRLYPTTEAKILFNEVEAVYGGVVRIDKLATQLAEKRQGLLSIVSSPSIGHSLIPRCIAKFKRNHPDVRIRFQTLTYEALVRNILDGQSDVGALFVPVRHPNLVSTKLGSIPMVCVMPADHFLCRKDGICISDLHNVEIISYRSGTPFSKIIDEIFKTSSEIANVNVEVDSQQNVCDLVREGVGIGIVDELTVNSHLGEALVVRPITPSYSIDLYLASSRYEPLSLLGQEFGELIKRELLALRKPAFFQSA